MGLTDIDILRKAWQTENDPRVAEVNGRRSWQGFRVGAGLSELHRFKEEGLIEIVFHTEAKRGIPGCTKYSLTEKGRQLAMPDILEHQMERVSPQTILDAMSRIIGFDDVKETMAIALSSERKINVLLEGPPGCSKSLILEAVRTSVPKAYLAFGSRTSGAGLSDILFEQQPKVLLIDELEKMRHDVFSILLGLMERGEIIETKSKKIRGIQLQTTVIGACNSSAKLPPEFLSRFALHVHFPVYTRDEFIDVIIGVLSQLDCPAELAEYIGRCVYDLELGDIRSARGVWDLVNAPTREEVDRVLHLKNKYSKAAASKRQAANGLRLM